MIGAHLRRRSSSARKCCSRFLRRLIANATSATVARRISSATAKIAPAIGVTGMSVRPGWSTQIYVKDEVKSINYTWLVPNIKAEGRREAGCEWREAEVSA